MATQARSQGSPPRDYQRILERRQDMREAKTKPQPQNPSHQTHQNQYPLTRRRSPTLNFVLHCQPYLETTNPNQRKNLKLLGSQIRLVEVDQTNFERSCFNIKFILGPVKKNLLRMQRKFSLQFLILEALPWTTLNCLSQNQIPSTLWTSWKIGQPLSNSYLMSLGHTLQKMMMKMPLLLSLSPTMGEQLTTSFALLSTRTRSSGITGPFAKQ